MANEPSEPEKTESDGASNPTPPMTIEPGPITPNRDRKRKPTVIDLKPDAVETKPEPTPDPVEPASDRPPPPPAGDDRPAFEPATETPPPPPPQKRSILPAAVGLVALVVIAGIGAGAYFLIQSHDADTAALQTRLAALQGRADALQARADDLEARLKTMAPSDSVAALDKKLTALEGTQPPGMLAFPARIEALEKHAVTSLAPAVPLDLIDKRIAALESQADTLRGHADQASHKADAAREEADKVMSAVLAANKTSPPTPILVAPSIDLSPLEARIGRLETSVAGLDRSMSTPKDPTRATEARAQHPSDALLPGAGFAVVTQTIHEALDAGLPYAPALSALEGMGAGAEPVADLKPFAESGAPTLATLKTEFSGVAGAIVGSAKSKPDDGGFLGRLTQGATGLVQVQPVGQTSGEDPAAIVTQVRAALDKGDVGGAVAAWGHLPESGKTASAAWADRAKGRVKADGAIHMLIAEAVSALGKSKS